MEAKIKEIVSIPIEKLVSADDITYVKTQIAIASWNPFPVDEQEKDPLGHIVECMNKMKAHPSYDLWSKANDLRMQSKHCFACGSKHVSVGTGGVRFGAGWRELEMYDCPECAKMSWFIVDPTLDPPEFGTLTLPESKKNRYDIVIDALSKAYGTH